MSFHSCMNENEIDQTPRPVRRRGIQERCRWTGGWSCPGADVSASPSAATAVLDQRAADKRWPASSSPAIAKTERKRHQRGRGTGGNAGKQDDQTCLTVSASFDDVGTDSRRTQRRMRMRPRRRAVAARNADSESLGGGSTATEEQMSGGGR